MVDLTVPFGGRGYKKPSSRMWAHPDSHRRSSSFTPYFELLRGRILETQGQLGES